MVARKRRYQVVVIYQFSSWKLVKLNNEKIRSLTYPEFFVYISVRSRFYLKHKRKETYNYRVVFSEL